MSGGSKQVKTTPEEKELAKIAGERWEDYKKRFIPVENLAIQDVMKDVETPSQFAPSMANLATQSEFSRLEPQVAQGLMARGGNLQEGLIGLNADRVASSGLGQAQAYGLDRGRTIGNLQTLVGIGTGQAGGAIQGLSSAADMAQRQAIMDARAAAAARAAMGQVIGIGAGIAGGAMMNGGTEAASAAGSAWTPASSAPLPNYSVPTPTFGMT